MEASTRKSKRRTTARSTSRSGAKSSGTRKVAAADRATNGSTLSRAQKEKILARFREELPALDKETTIGIQGLDELARSS